MSGARPTTANMAAMPTTAKAPDSIGDGQISPTSKANPVPTAAPMNSDGMKAPPDAPEVVVRLVATALPIARRIRIHHTEEPTSPARSPLMTA